MKCMVRPSDQRWHLDMEAKFHKCIALNVVNHTVAKSKLVTVKWGRWSGGNCSVFVFKIISNGLLETT